MHQPCRSKLLEAYRALPADLQAVVNLLAVYHGYCSLTNIAKMLAGLGIKEGSRVLKSETVKARLRPLIAEGLLEENVRPGGTRCSRLLVETLTRQLIADREFEIYAAEVLASSPQGNSYYRYNTAEDCIREARIHFHRGDYQEMQNCLEIGRRYPGNLPVSADLYLAWFMNPLDVAWFQNRHGLIVGNLAEYAALHQKIYLYAQTDLDGFFAAYLATDEGRSNTTVVTSYLELQLLRGNWEEVRASLGGVEDPELVALAAAVKFLHGNFAGALADYERALVNLRKLLGQRNAYFLGLAGIFYPLALLKQGEGKARAKLATLLNQAIKENGYWTLAYQYLQTFLSYQQGDLQARDRLLNMPFSYRVSSGFRDTGMPDSVVHTPILLAVLFLLIKFWCKADFTNRVDAVERQLYSHLLNNGYAWPAAELAKLFSALQPSSQPQCLQDFWVPGRQALADLFVSRADWEVALDALLHLQVADKKPGPAEASDKATRLVWLLTYAEGGSVKIEPREQKQQAKGGWSKGRAVALKRLAHERDSFDYLSEADLKLCEYIKEYRESGWYGAGTYFEFSSGAVSALIGHPLLFWAGAPEVKVEVVKGEAELRVSNKNNGKIQISLEPNPGYEQKYQVIKESPTRLRVVEFNADHHRIFAVLGPKGLEVPVAATEKVLQTLTSISSLLTVHSDIGGSSATAEQVEADATPRVHLLPHGEGLRVSVLVRPFAAGGAYFQAGQGGASVLAEVDGKRLQAQRNFEREHRLATAVVEACPSLQAADRDASGDWLLTDPEACLEFLLQIQALPEGEAILEWPEGVRFKVLGQASGSGMSVSVKRDNDWFSLQGELKIDDQTVLDMQQLLGLLDQRQGRFLQLKSGEFLALTDEFRRRLEDLKAYADFNGKKLRLNPLAALTLEDWQQDDGFKADKHWQAHIVRLQAAREFQPLLPSTFQAELRDYQLEGYRWLSRLAQWGVGACLADDMGLGKTVQGLALLVERAPLGPALIVAPTSVCANWQAEAHRFAPTLNPTILGAGDRQQLLGNLKAFDVLICSYGLLQQEQVADMLADIEFASVVLDEAQWIKNVATRRSQGAMNLKAGFKLIMTGTPLENHLGELWNLFRFINPGLLGSLEQYNKRFAGPIERDRNQEARYRLKKLIQPFILRRTKTQVLQELPPRTEIPIYVELSNEEHAFYEALRRDSLAGLEEAVDSNPGQKQLQILAAITRLRRSCCNTRLVNPDLELPSSKLDALGEIIDELMDNKHKALLFSQFVDHLQLIREFVERRGISYQYLDGSTPAKERQQRVDAFQRGKGDLFLISLKAGGVGLNLTAADFVIHMDPWWNPAVEDQASDRAHRMGQQRPVTIYRMIAKNTIEEKIVALHSHKRDLADSLLDGTDVSGKVSADELLSLIKSEA